MDWNPQIQERAKRYYENLYQQSLEEWRKLGLSFDEFATNNEIAWDQQNQAVTRAIEERDRQIQNLQNQLNQIQIQGPGRGQGQGQAIQSIAGPTQPQSQLVRGQAPAQRAPAARPRTIIQQQSQLPSQPYIQTLPQPQTQIQGQGQGQVQGQGEQFYYQPY